MTQFLYDSGLGSRDLILPDGRRDAKDGLWESSGLRLSYTQVASANLSEAET